MRVRNAAEGFIFRTRVHTPWEVRRSLSAMLPSMKKPPARDRHTGAIGIMRVVFGPEPPEFLLLVAGVGFLTVHYRRHVRGSRVH